MSKPSLSTRCLLTVLAAALGACASADRPAALWSEQLRADGWQPGAAVATVLNFRIDGFRVLDNSHLVIYSGFGRRHLVSFGTPCPGLLFAERLGYHAIDGSLGRLDHLIVFGQGTHIECVIDSMQPLEKLAG
jgi:hypothetical protein